MSQVLNLRLHLKTQLLRKTAFAPWNWNFFPSQRLVWIRHKSKMTEFFLLTQACCLRLSFCFWEFRIVGRFLLYGVKCWLEGRYSFSQRINIAIQYGAALLESRDIKGVINQTKHSFYILSPWLLNPKLNTQRPMEGHSSKLVVPLP